MFLSAHKLEILTDEQEQSHFDNFFEDVFIELEDKVGIVLNVCKEYVNMCKMNMHLRIL